MNAPVPRIPAPPPPPDSWIRLVDRMEKHVRWYRWLTVANVFVFGTNIVFMGVYLIASYWLRH
jgi:hypothetical protein